MSLVKFTLDGRTVEAPAGMLVIEAAKKAGIEIPSFCYYEGALTRIAAAILRNQRGVLTVSSVLEGEFGLNGVSLGVPCILSRSGVERVLQVTLPPDEQSALVKSATILREAIEQLELAVAS